jgi:hypothetical protein
MVLHRHSICSTIFHGLVLSARNDSNRKRNNLHAKAMKLVSYSFFDVGRSMFGVRFGCANGRSMVFVALPTIARMS